jgi:hypothetical protein
VGKFELILFMCSMVAQECAEPKPQIHLYRSHYDCIAAGYLRSFKEVQILKEDNVNDLKIVISFTCKEITES